MKVGKGKIILTFIVIYFTIFAFININKEKDMNKEILGKVVYVTDGVVNPENEGKIVLVSGKIGYDNLVGLLELENFSSIKVSRKVEDYVKQYDEDNDEYDYKWKEREKPLENNDGDYLKSIVSEERVSKVKIGDFELDEKGLSLIPTDKYYSKQEKVGDLITKGIYYSTSEGRMWMSRYTGSSCGEFRSLTDGGRELLANTSKGLYYSTSAGRSWMKRS